jgi:large subunit GTPase 1
MRSVTEQAALDEFLSTAELAGTDFTAEKMNNVKIIHTDQKNPYLLSAAEERAAVGKHKAHKDRLTVPRRPHWSSSTTPEELDRMERDGFLEWRRGLAELQESNDLLMTPFERNLEVWRQLWRVIERSDLVVQIVDARNPLLFRSEDLEKYVKHVGESKKNLLLINKADMLTLEQRQAWADYFEKADIAYTFFSASLAKELNETRDLDERDESDDKDLPANAMDVSGTLAAKTKQMDLKDDGEESEVSSEEEEEELYHSAQDERSRILTVDELEAVFLAHAPDNQGNMPLFVFRDLF